MKKTLGAVIASLLVVLCLTLFSTGSAPARSAQASPIVMQEFSHDVSLPVRMYPTRVSKLGPHVVLPWRRSPLPAQISNEPDAVLQDLELFPRPLVAATIGVNVDGISDRDLVAPPDTNASVGATQVVETVNLSYQVYNKSGTSVFGPAEVISIFTGLAGHCTSDGNTSDPVVLYDKAAGRWVISILAFNNSFSQTDECIAVSTTSDATGSYNRYDFNFGANLPDYQKLAVWPDAYYFSANIFPNGGFFTGAEPCAFNRTAMLAGNTATMVCPKGAIPADFSLLPSDLDGATQPASGEPNFFLELNGTSKLNLFQFHVDFNNPNNSTFTGPSVINVTSFTQACAATGTCIPQSGTSQKLDSLGDRLMFRLAYRNFGDHEALVATHSVKGSSKTAANVRWYEIRSPKTPTLFQSGTLASGSTSLWMGSIAQDKVGDIAVGFSESSSKIHPAIEFTGRVPTDALGTLESIALIHSGNGSQNGGLSRWGDYSSLAIDPSDDCTFWYANEYIPSNGSFNWHTRLTNFKFTGCH